MKFDDLIESIYVGNLNGLTNNHYYIHLTRNELLVIKEILERNPFFEVARVRDYSSHSKSVDFDRMRNIYVDFAQLNIENLFNYIFFVLNLNYRVDYLSFNDLKVAIDILKENNANINLHIFNIESLDKKEQTLLNNLLFLNYNSMIMQIYVEDDIVLKSNVNSNGEYLEEGIHYQVLEVLEPTYKLDNIVEKEKVDILEKKAS